ncbi:MAG: phosphoribosylformylglycinamidine synthase subunit PurQ, partial [bacterium]|nr:phosphoribosylformylglycinamidine synthase subunit PurQ [bacterium]
TGAMAAQSPVMKAVAAFADRGGLVLGICNGFQILCETRLLPGVLVRNKGLKFICEMEELILERVDTPFTSLYKEGERVKMPIAHMEGHYYVDDAGLASLKKKNQIVFRYAKNPNGSVGDIAGVINEQGNVLGLMPHPERVCEEVLGGEDGLKLFESIMVSF